MWWGIGLYKMHLAEGPVWTCLLNGSIGDRLLQFTIPTSLLNAGANHASSRRVVVTTADQNQTSFCGLVFHTATAGAAAVCDGALYSIP